MFHQVSWYVPHMFSYLITDVLIFPYIFGMFWLCPYISLIFHDVFFMFASWIDWFNGTFTRKSHISWENLWFPVDFPFFVIPLNLPCTKRISARHLIHWSATRTSVTTSVTVSGEPWRRLIGPQIQSWLQQWTYRVQESSLCGTSQDGVYHTLWHSFGKSHFFYGKLTINVHVQYLC